MDQVSVGIQIQQDPDKRQDRFYINLEIDRDASISEIIQFLVAQEKLIHDPTQVMVLMEKQKISHNMIISDILQPNQQKIKLSMSAYPQITIPERPPLSVPIPFVPNLLKTSINFQSSSQISQIPKFNENIQEKESMFFSNHSEDFVDQRVEPMKEPLFKKNNQFEFRKSYLGLKNDTKTYTTDSQQIQSQNKKIQTSNINKQKSNLVNENDDIDVKLEYREGGYFRQFRYTSKKQQESNQGTISSQNNTIVISIVDNNRKIKFQVQKI